MVGRTHVHIQSSSWLSNIKQVCFLKPVLMNPKANFILGPSYYNINEDVLCAEVSDSSHHSTLFKWKTQTQTQKISKNEECNLKNDIITKWHPFCIHRHRLFTWFLS